MIPRPPRSTRPDTFLPYTTLVLADMASPGVSVRPIITLDGAHEVNDVFFEDVRVPVANGIGEEDRGWTYAKRSDEHTCELQSLLRISYAVFCLNKKSRH